MADETKTLLFVDDEQSILSSLRRLLRKEKWGLRFANSGPEGLKILKEQPVDLVVSDMRMPEMDGAAFLKEVKAQFPNTIRIILSGYAEKEAVESVLQEECAHQMLTKPWEEDELKALLRSLLNQTEVQKGAGQWLRETFNTMTSLPTLPQIYLQSKEALAKSEDLSAARIAEVIERDPSVSLRLLRWANSALFGQPSRVETVQRAVVILGTEMVQGLVLSMSVFDALSGDTAEVDGFSREAFWDHSIACGNTARLIARQMGAVDKAADRAFTAGLLHDLGKLVEDRYCHDRFGQAVALARDKKITLRETEQEVLQITHMEVGAYLAEWWNLPPLVINAIRWHHTPHLCEGEQEMVAVVHVADALVQKFNVGASGNFRAAKVETESWSRFKLTRSRLQSIKDLLTRQFQ